MSSSRRRPVIAGALVVVVLLITLTVVAFARWQQRGATTLVQPATTSSPTQHSSPSTVPRPSRQGALPLRGVALRGPTGLRLLVADAPAPFVLDVDRGTVESIRGLPGGGDRGVDVLPVGNDALVLSSRFCTRCRTGVYLVRRGSTAATPFSRTLQAVASRDGEGAWVFSRRDASRCTIGEVDLDGRSRRTARQVRCRTGLVAELPAGLLINSVGPLGTDAHSALLKPGGRLVRVGDWLTQPVVANLVLSGADSHTPLVLRELRTGASHKLSWPSRPGYSLGDVTGEPNSRLAIVGFAKFSPEHRLDLWLLDTRTRRWHHLPGMPAGIIPKTTNVRWTADGRVVILSSNVLGIWRPGAPRLAVREVKPPKQPGSRFVVW